MLMFSILIAAILVFFAAVAYLRIGWFYMHTYPIYGMDTKVSIINWIKYYRPVLKELRSIKRSHSDISDVFVCTQALRARLMHDWVAAVNLAPAWRDKLSGARVTALLPLDVQCTTRWVEWPGLVGPGSLFPDESAKAFFEETNQYCWKPDADGKPVWRRKGEYLVFKPGQVLLTLPSGDLRSVPVTDLEKYTPCM